MDAVGAAWHSAGLELVVSDGGAFDSAPDQVAVQAVGQVAAIEPVGPFPQIARQVLGADAVMGADEPGFDVAEQGIRLHLSQRDQALSSPGGQGQPGTLCTN